MSRLTLWIVNAGLLVLAAAVTVWVVGQKPLAADVDGRGDPKNPRTERKSERKAGPREAAETPPSHDAVSTADSEVLWQQTLFRPERTEDLSVPAPEDAAAANAALNLELVGLARIGDRAVAIIVQHRGQAVRRAQPVLPGLPGGVARSVARGPAVLAVPGEGGEEPAAGPPDRHVYKVGDKVGDSGYSLKEIRLQEKEAVLLRGAEERTLKLETDDDQSTSRRETAAVVPPQPKPAIEAAATPRPPGEAAPPPGAVPALPPGVAPPPPPPGMAAPGAGTATGQVPVVGGEGGPARETPGVVPMSREERLERARLLRERILQGRPPSGSSN